MMRETELSVNFELFCACLVRNLDSNQSRLEVDFGPSVLQNDYFAPSFLVSLTALMAGNVFLRPGFLPISRQIILIKSWFVQ